MQTRKITTSTSSTTSTAQAPKRQRSMLPTLPTLSPLPPSTTSTTPTPRLHPSRLEPRRGASRPQPSAPPPPQAPTRTPALQAPTPPRPSTLAGAASARAACTIGFQPANGGAGSGAGGSARRRPRLNVTEAERLCYSRRKLHALSALRNAGLDPAVCGLHKDYRVPGMRGRVYLLEDPHSTVYAFSSLAEIEGYAAEQRMRREQPPTWNPWRTDPPSGEPKRVECGWPECGYYANGLFAGQPFCRPHGMIYEQFLLAKARQVP